MHPRTARTFGRAAALAFLAVAVLAPTAAEAVTPASVTLTGTYTLVHVDGTVGHPGADGYRQELRTSGRVLDVALPDGTAFRSGDRVQLSGRINGDTLHVNRSHIQSFAPDTVTVAGTTRVLVVLAEWTAPDATTPADAANVFAADDSWFQQTSYGHLSLSTTVAGWVQVSAPAAGLCSDTSVSDQLTDRAVAASGYNPDAFDRVVVYFPDSSDPSCADVAGFAEAPGNRVWLNGVMDTRSSIHEQGHNYGLYHAHAALCTEPGSSVPTAAPDATADNCNFADYGDPYDAMGASGYVAEYSASQKNLLGWLDDGRAAALTPGGSVALVPYEQQSAAVHVASFSAGATRTYWFENRTATGPDAALPSGATDGVLVHVDDAAVDAAAGDESSWAPVQTYLLDQSPADEYVGSAVLPYGQSWTSPEGVTFTVGRPGDGTVAISATGVPSTVSPSVAAQPPTASLRLPGGRPTVTVAEGTAVRLSATVQRAPGATVSLQTSVRGRHSWRTVKSWTVAGDGRLSAVVHPRASTDYRLRVTGTLPPLTSGTVAVVTRPVVQAAVSKARVQRGRTVRLDVSIPGHAGQVVVVQEWAHNAWHDYASVRLGPDGRRTITVRPLAAGQVRFRFVKARDLTHLAASSKPLQVRVL